MRRRSPGAGWRWVAAIGYLPVHASLARLVWHDGMQLPPYSSLQVYSGPRLLLCKVPCNWLDGA